MPAISSVSRSPPQAVASGWSRSTARDSISSANPHRVYADSPPAMGTAVAARSSR